MTPPTPDPLLTETLRGLLLDHPQLHVLCDESAAGDLPALAKQFGADRVRTAAVASSSMVSIGAGFARAGVPVVVELAESARLLQIADELIEHVARARICSAGKLTMPLVVRVRCSEQIHCLGGVVSRGHIQTACAATGVEAAAQLRTAVLSRKPSVLLECGPFGDRSKPDAEAPTTSGPAGMSAQLLRKGSQATLLCWGCQTRLCLAALERFDGKNAVEVVQLRWIEPLDLQAIRASLRKTGRLLVADGGVGEVGDAVLSAVATECFDLLDRPPLRIGAETGGLRAVTMEQLVAGLATDLA